MSGHPLSSLRRSAGETLIETVLAVMILGISVAAVSGAVMMATGAAAMNSQLTDSDMILRSWAERVAVAQYERCRDATDSSWPKPPLIDPDAPDWTDGGPGTWEGAVGEIQYTATIAEVAYWDNKATNPGFVGTCDPPSEDSGIQRVTIQVTSEGLGLPSTAKTLEVTVRNPCKTVDPDEDDGCSA